MLSEEALDVDVEHPVGAPASLASRPDGVDRRPAGTITVGVGVERRFQQRLQVSSDHLLRDTIGDRRDTQRARSAACFRYVHPAYRRGHVAARRQSVPELIEVGGKPQLEALDRLLVDPSRSLVGLHALEGLAHFPLRDVERLRRRHAVPPVTG
jgi:hypothetical protein